MATRRTDIQINVTGLADLQAANSALSTNVRQVQRLTSAYQALNAVTGQTGSVIQNITNDMRTYNQTTNQTNNNITNLRNNLGSANTAGQNFLGTMLRYRAVSLVFEGVQKSVMLVVDTMNQMERQAARVQRVATPGSTPLIRSTIAEEVARTGADVKDIGEAYYQLGTQVHNADDQFTALKATMNLVVGTEADAREAARGMLQIYNQFPNAFDKSISQGEALARIGNLLALTWKDSSAELSDVLGSLKYLGPVAEATGDSLANVLAIITGGTIKGQRGRMLGTGFSQVLLTLGKKYQTDLPGGPGIQDKDGTVYHFKMVYHEDGKSIDSLKTLMNMVQAVNSEAAKSPEIARKMQLAIFGNIQGFRAGATETVKDIQNMEAAAKRNTEETKRTSQAAEQLRKDMSTTAQEWKRVWGGTIDSIVAMLDSSGLRHFFKDVADELQRTVDIARQARGLESENNSRMLGTLTTGPQRSQTQQTRDTVQQALSNLLRDPNRGTLSESLLQSPLDVAAEGMTAAEKDMLRRRYQIPGNPLHRLREDVMRSDIASMEAQLANPMWGLPPRGSLLPAPVTGLRGLPGFDQSGKPIVTPGDKSNDDALKKRQEALDLAAKMAQQYLENAKKEFGENSPLVAPFAKRADDAAKAAMRDQPDQIYALTHGLTGNVANYQKAVEDANKERQEQTAEQLRTAQKQRADMLEYHAANSAEKYGPFSDIATQRAKEAQQAAEIVAKNETDFLGLQKLYDSAQGPLKDLKDKQKEVWEKSADSIKQTLATLDQSQNDLASELVAAGGRKISGFQRGLRPNLASGAETREQGVLENTISTIETIIARLKAIPDKTDQTNREIETMHDRLLDANAALVDFNDRLQAQALQRRIKSEEEAFALRAEDITHLHRLRFAKDDEGAYRNKVGELGELLANSRNFLETVKDRPGADSAHQDQVREAARKVTEAQQNLNDFQIDAKIQKYLNVYGGVKATVHDSLSAFFHGQGDIGNVAQSIGGTIVQAALDQQIKRFSDPLISTVTNEILAIQGNTDALEVLNSTMTGGALSGSSSSSPFVSSVAAGVQQGMQDFGWGPTNALGGKGGKTTGRGAGGGTSDLQKGIGAGLAAYSIGATSAQQGVNAGNFLGGVLSGASIGASSGPGGGLVGGIVGGAVDLIGGLFHHNNKPTDTPQNLNPAYYNAPSNFNVAAYDYSAYGKLPTLQRVGFDVTPTNVPIINVYVDGAKVAAQKEISRQVSSVNVSLNNTTRDRYKPV